MSIGCHQPVTAMLGIFRDTMQPPEFRMDE